MSTFGAFRCFNVCSSTFSIFFCSTYSRTLLKPLPIWWRAEKNVINISIQKRHVYVRREWEKKSALNDWIHTFANYSHFIWWNDAIQRIKSAGGSCIVALYVVGDVLYWLVFCFCRCCCRHLYMFTVQTRQCQTNRYQIV